MSLIFEIPSGRSSSLRQLISAKWARALSRVPHLARRPGSLRRHRSLELRGPVAGGADEGTGSQRAVTNCMKGVKIAGTSPKEYSQCPPLLDEPATDTLLVILKVHVCPGSLCLSELSQVRERAEVRMFGGQDFIAGFVGDAMRTRPSDRGRVLWRLVIVVLPEHGMPIDGTRRHPDGLHSYDCFRKVGSGLREPRSSA